MPNRNKQKGDRFESATLLTSRSFFPDAFRTRAGWDDDRGDIVLVREKLIVQSKDCQSKPWYVWLDELDAQVKNAQAEYGCVVSKRPGKSDAGEAMAIMRYRDWLAMAQHV